PHTVMTGTREPRIRRNRHLDRAGSFHLDQRGKKAMRAIEKLHVPDAFTFEYAVVHPASLMFSPESLFRTEFAKREETIRIQLSPLPRVAARVPQTQSACLSASSIAGKSRGSFFRSASSAAMYRLRDVCIPAQLAADSPQLAFIAHIDRLTRSISPSRTRQNCGEGIRAERTEPNTLILPTPLVREWRQKCPNEILISFRR